MKFPLVILLLHSLLVQFCSAITIACTFQDASSNYQGTLYQCKTANDFQTQNDKVTDVTGTHTSGKTNNDVRSLYLGATYIYYMPKDFDLFFKNIEYLYVLSPSSSTGAKYGPKTLDKNDMKQFPKLKELTIYYSSFIYIENDFFDYIPNIEYFYFYYSGTYQFGTDFFGPLKYLKGGLVYDGSCAYSSDVATTEAALTALKNYLTNSCKPTELMLKYEEYRKETKRFENERNALSVNLSEKTKSLAVCDKSVESLKRFIKQSSSPNNKKNQCDLQALETEQCEAQLSILDEFRKEITAVTMTCAMTTMNDSILSICTPKFFNVNYKQSEIKSVMSRDNEPVKGGKVHALIIEDQQVLYLPNNLGKRFTKLHQVSVISSRLMEIGDNDFRGLAQLEHLNMKKNLITEIGGACFSPLVNLEQLDLSSNKIEKIDINAFRTLKKLIELNLNDNSITELKGNTFVSLSSLEKLELQNNQLKFIGTRLLHPLKAIKTADLSNNICVNMTHPEDDISEIDEEIAKVCAPPVDLCCDFSQDLSNQDSSTDDQICEARNFVVDNAMTKLVSVKSHDECNGNVAARTINGSNVELEKVSVLIIEDMSVQYLPDGFAKHLPSLIKLVVMNSELTALERANFAGLKKLLTLKIIGNNISFIADDAFDEIPQLINLDLSKNHIVSLPNTVFWSLQKLKTLNIASNALTHLGIPSTLFSRKNVVEELYCQDNPLQEINRRLLNVMKFLKTASFKDTECINAVFPKEKNLQELKIEIALSC